MPATPPRALPPNDAAGAARPHPFPSQLSQPREENDMSSEWPLWEIFIRGQHGLNHRHVGSLHAPDADMAIRNARDVYTRRNEGVSIWVVKSAEITASSPSEKGPLFEPSNSK